MTTKKGIQKGKKQVFNAARVMRCYCCGYLNIQSFIAGDWDGMCNHVCGHSFFQSKRAQLMLDLWRFGEILPPDLAYVETRGDAEYSDPFAVYLGKTGSDKRNDGLAAFLSDYERLQDGARRLGKPVKALLAEFIVQSGLSAVAQDEPRPERSRPEGARPERSRPEGFRPDGSPR